MLWAGVENAFGNDVLVELVVIPGPAGNRDPAAFGALALVASEVEVIGHGVEYVAWCDNRGEEAKSQVGRPEWAA